MEGATLSKFGHIPRLSRQLLRAGRVNSLHAAPPTLMFDDLEHGIESAFVLRSECAQSSNLHLAPKHIERVRQSLRDRTRQSSADEFPARQ
jgi:hypothetical protein